jgi:glycosyltransferase involved in cell wall biosynthesis
MGTTMQKRVGFFMLNPDLWFGGGQIALLRVAQWLVNKGIPTTIIVARMDSPLPFRLPDEVAFVNLKVPMPKLGSRPLGFGLVFSAVLGLARFLRQNSLTTLVGPGWAEGSVTLWGRRLAQVPLRSIIWEQVCVSSMARFSINTYQRLAPHIVRWSYQMADVIVGCSQSVADDIATLTGKPRGSIWVIYNPLPPDLERRAEEPLDHPWFAPDQPPVILSVGRLSPQKDFPTLLKAFWLVRRHHRVRLVILGEGSERGKLEGMVRRMGLEGEVSLLGFVENPFKFMKRAKVFVLSSRFEGFPLVLVEALALGMRVVATDCESGPREILGGGRWGILVSVGDAEGMAEGIGRMLEGEVDREALVRRGREFSLERVGTQWLKLLKDLG